jgi:D-glycero-alpha-D-manno-heptose-7-phosphate kinase
MFIAKTPLRISFFGGSTDHPSFIKKYKKSTVINFASNLYTHTTIFRDKFGYNSQENKYVLNYSKKENCSNLSSIKNDLIRECLNYHKVPPVCVHFAGDIFAKGSGLGSSSSYTLSLLKCIYKYKKKEISQYNLAKEALFIERRFNKYCGYQDPFGCGTPGFKIINTTNDDKYFINTLGNEIFKKFHFYLLPTFIHRNSKKILKNLSKKLNLIYPLLEVAKDAENHILNKDYLRFLKLIKISWDLKKQSSPEIIKNNKLIRIDNSLENNTNIISHKLLGAGAGGFFLIVSKKKINNYTSSHAIKLQVHEK